MFNKKKLIFIFLTSAIIIVSVGIVALNVGALYGNVVRTLGAKNALINAIESRDNARIALAISEARRAISVSAKDNEILRGLSFLPGINNEAEAIGSIISQTNYLLDSLELGLKIAQEAGIDLFGALKLKQIDAALVNNKEVIEKLAEQGNGIVKDEIFKSRINKISDLKEKLALYVQKAAQVEKFVASSEDGVAEFAGLRGEKKYLLLFENSQELRPGGGLISTYGTINIKDGHAAGLSVEHVQNLGAMYALPLEKNPEPIQKLRHQKNLYIYDTNWLSEPNAWLEKIFTSWNAQKPRVDGIIVVSTKMLEDLVRRYEPIRLAGFNQELRAADIVASLDYHFDVEQKNIDARKYEVLAPLVDRLVKNIEASKPSELAEILQIIETRFQSRDIFVYSDNAATNKAFKNMVISNDLPVAQGDEFYALEANLGNGKSDAQMRRSLAMNVYAQDAKPFSMATITHDYTTGKNDFRSDGYYGYLRYLLPTGSRLGSFDGFDLTEDEKSIEAGRQVFGNYFSVATGTKKDLAITYALSNKVADDIKNGKYSLTLRKQGGVEMPYEIKIYVPESWKNPAITVSGGSAEFVKKQKAVIWRGVLMKDTTIDIEK